MIASASQQDHFFSELKEAPDGFSVVTEHFGRGLMNLTAAATSSGMLATDSNPALSSLPSQKEIFK
jgi:hypothetical protein